MPHPFAFGIRVRIIGRCHGSQTVNVLHFGTNTDINDGPNLDPILLEIANDILECVVEQLLPIITSDWNLVQVDAQRFHPSVSNPVVAAAPQNATGAGSPASVSFAASLVNLKTFRGGRSGRGRVFLPPVGETVTTNSGIDGPTLAAIAQFLACLAGKFLAPNNTKPHEWCVFSRKLLGGIGGNFDAAMNQVTQAIPSNAVACLRSRKVGVGS
jgi:hypothetical protein